MNRILVVEDEATLRNSLVSFLSQEGFEVCEARNAREASASLEQDPDVVLMDWRLPDGEGLELVRQWRQSGNAVPIVMLTAKADTIDKVLGLEMGADDYLTKPFEPRELVARLKVQLRKKQLQTKEILKAHGIQLDTGSREVHFKGKPVELTRMEYELLKLLMSKPGQVFSRDELLNQVWGFDKFPTTRTVDTHILQLRTKFASELFETLRGIGYRMTINLPSHDTPYIKTSDSGFMAIKTKEESHEN